MIWAETGIFISVLYQLCRQFPRKIPICRLQFTDFCRILSSEIVQDEEPENSNPPCGDFNFLIPARSTASRGANLQYIGRNPIDAATLDRFDDDENTLYFNGVQFDRAKIDRKIANILRQREGR
jgi:hypothetical protein